MSDIKVGDKVERDFEQELCMLLNKHSAENTSNTPDFILAQYLVACLAAYETAVQQRETWYGRDARLVADDTHYDIMPSVRSILRLLCDDASTLLDRLATMEQQHKQGTIYLRQQYDSIVKMNDDLQATLAACEQSRDKCYERESEHADQSNEIERLSGALAANEDASLQTIVQSDATPVVGVEYSDGSFDGFMFTQQDDVGLAEERRQFNEKIRQLEARVRELENGGIK